MELDGMSASAQYEESRRRSPHPAIILLACASAVPAAVRRAVADVAENPPPSALLGPEVVSN
jgi:hypothetical protein